MDVHGWTGKAGRSVSGLLVLLFIVSNILPLMVPVNVVRGAVVNDPFTDPNGLMWAPTLKVTKNNFDDEFPSMRLDPGGNANIIYQQSSTDYMLARVSPPGTVLLSEKRLQSGYIPTQYQIKNESTPQPTRFFDIGPDGSIHIVWTEAGLLDNKYQRFDAQGEPLTAIVPMNQITDLSRLPNLGIGSDGRAYIAYENEGTAWIQMTYVDQEGYLRSPTLIGRPGENVAFTIAPDGTLHLFYRSLGLDPRINYVKLDKDRRFIVSPRIVFSSWPLIANANSSMPALTVTPNGHVHLLISNTTVAPHPIYYIELDGNGTPVSDFMKVADSAYNYGDIAAEPDNSVYIAWDDVKDGEVHYRQIKDGVLGKDIVVTNTGGKARHPVICSDKTRGDLHLVYVDMNGGEGALYYRYANNYRIVMDIPELAKARSVHPGQGSVNLDVTVTNFGDIPVRITLNSSVDYHGLQGHNWSFIFNSSEVEIGPGQTMKRIAVLTGPSVGDPGEGVDVSITATPKGTPYKAVTVAFRSTLVIDRVLSLSGPSGWPLKQKTQYLPLNLTNSGDLPETVDLTVVGGQPGWSLAMDRSNATLGPGARIPLKLYVTLPDNEAQDTVVPVSVVAVSRSQPSTTARLDMGLIAYPSVFLAPPTGKISVELDSGTSKSVKYPLWNQGLSDGVFNVSANVVRADEGWEASVLTPSLTIHANRTATIELVIKAPDRSIAGLGLVADLVIKEVDMRATETVRVEALVIEKRGLTVTGDGNATVLPGQSAVLPVTVRNLGNSERQVELSVMPLPAGWKWQYGEEAGLTIGPFEERTYELFVTAPKDSKPMEQLVNGTVTSDGETFRFFAIISVGPVFGMSVSAVLPLVRAALGSEASFDLLIYNKGTAADTFTLLTDGLPTGITAKFVSNDVPVQTITAYANATVSIGLILKLPDRFKGASFSFWAGARSSHGAVAGLGLVVELYLPDLRVKDVVFDENGLKDGDSRKVTVIVANDGDSYAYKAVVDLNGMEKTIDLTAGTETNITYTVKFHAGDTALVAVVDPANTIQEKREDNNDYIAQVQVTKGGTIPGFDAPMVVVTTVFVVIFGIRRSRLIRD